MRNGQVIRNMYGIVVQTSADSWPETDRDGRSLKLSIASTSACFGCLRRTRRYPVRLRTNRDSRAASSPAEAWPPRRRALQHARHGRCHPSVILTLRLDVRKRTPQWQGRDAQPPVIVSIRACVDFAVPSSALHSPLIGSAATHRYAARAAPTQTNTHPYADVAMMLCCHARVALHRPQCFGRRSN